MLAKGCRFDVTHIADPTAALALAAARPWDLVITDLDLPLMSGFEVAAILRRMAPELPVIIVTAYPQDAPILTSATRGAQPNALLAKPITVDLLLDDGYRAHRVARRSKPSSRTARGSASCPSAHGER